MRQVMLRTAEDPPRLILGDVTFGITSALTESTPIALIQKFLFCNRYTLIALTIEGIQASQSF